MDSGLEFHTGPEPVPRAQAVLQQHFTRLGAEWGWEGVLGFLPPTLRPGLSAFSRVSPEQPVILQGELGSVPFLPRAKERFPAKGLECSHVLVKSGARGHQVKKSVIPFRPAYSRLWANCLSAQRPQASLCALPAPAGSVGPGGWPGLPEKLREPRRWSLWGRESGNLVGPGEEGEGLGARSTSAAGTLNKKHMI